MSEYRVRLQVDIVGGWPDTPAEENYYTPEQLAQAAVGWIEGALDDRDDVHGSGNPVVTVISAEPVLKNIPPLASPEGLDSVTLAPYSGGAKDVSKKVTFWHIRTDPDYAPLGTQPGETLDEAIGNLIGRWNGVGGFVYEEKDFRKTDSGWVYTKWDRNIPVYGEKFTGTIYVADTSE